MKTLREIINEHIRYRSQIWTLSESDRKKTYKGSALGWLWAFIKPSMTIFVFWFAMTLGFRGSKNIEGIFTPYFLWLVVGMVAWFYMRDMIAAGAGCFKKYKSLVTKIKFPISIIPTVVSLSKLTIHAMLMGGVMILFFIFGFPPTLYWIQLPFYMLLMFVFAILWSILGGLLSVMSADFLNLVKSFTSAIFWLSGILFDVNSIPYSAVRALFLFNPVTFFVTSYRNIFTKGVWFYEDLPALGGFAITLLIVLVLAMWLYSKLRKDIPDVL